MFLGIKETTREYRLKKWAGIIAEQRKSGLTIRAFCADWGLSQQPVHISNNLDEVRVLSLLPVALREPPPGDLQGK